MSPRPKLRRSYYGPEAPHCAHEWFTLFAEMVRGDRILLSMPAMACWSRKGRLRPRSRSRIMRQSDNQSHVGSLFLRIISTKRRRQPIAYPNRCKCASTASTCRNRAAGGMERTRRCGDKIRIDTTVESYSNHELGRMSPGGISLAMRFRYIEASKELVEEEVKLAECTSQIQPQKV